MTGTILDIGLGVVALIALLVGLKKGLIRQLTALLSGLVSFAGAVVLVVIISPFIQPLEIFTSFTGITTGWFSGEIFTTTVTSIDDLNAVLTANPVFSLLTSFSDKFFADMQLYEYNTLGQLCGRYVANVIVDFVLWLVIFIILKLLFKLLKTLLLKVTDLPVIHTIDKVFGAIWSVAIAYVIVIGILLTAVEIVAIKFLPDFAVTLLDMIGSSKIMCFAHDSNIIGSFLANFVGVTLPKINIPLE